MRYKSAAMQIVPKNGLFMQFSIVSRLAHAANPAIASPSPHRLPGMRRPCQDGCKSAFRTGYDHPLHEDALAKKEQ